MRCNPGEINQVIMNLVVNAAQAIDGEGTITVETRHDGDTVSIRVSDTGAGITPDAVDELFTPFFTTKPPGEGTGLGLSISHGIVERHGGRIDVESVRGEGSTFTVVLPLDGARAATGFHVRHGELLRDVVSELAVRIVRPVLLDGARAAAGFHPCEEHSLAS